MDIAKVAKRSLVIISLLVALAFQLCFTIQPNIIMIVADDLGWNDVSFHGSPQIPTPNIDKLANDGVILNNYYVTPICSPTRSAIMTGKYPIHTEQSVTLLTRERCHTVNISSGHLTYSIKVKKLSEPAGMQTSVIHGPNAWGLSLNETLLPQYLKSLGYDTHAIGKWHVGFFAKEYTPTYRGFDSFYGYYQGKSDYWDHSNYARYWGLDLHDNEEPVWTQWGNYSTDLYTAIAIDKIKKHDQSRPLFLYLAYQAVHSANRPADPIQAPDSWIKKFSHIKNEGRRKYAAVTACLDDAIGKVYKSLEDSGMLGNTVIVFTTDNGGPANGFDFNYANNYPLRGVKASLWEGGVRGVGFVHSKLIKNPGRVSRDLLHVTDWLPTFVALAGGNSPHGLDGSNIWETVSSGAPSPRTEILLNIDPLVRKNAALRLGDYKIVVGEGGYWSGWFPPPEVTSDVTANLHEDAVINCGFKPANRTDCKEKHGPCLFNIKTDPCEYHDLSKDEPEMLATMLDRLNYYQSTMVKPRNNFTVDPRSDPKLHGGVWVPWIN